MDLFSWIGERIRQLRLEYGEGRGLSQEALAQGLDVAPNTISRWETATYHPGLEDIERLARFFSVSILTFFPPEQVPEDEEIKALLRAAAKLKKNDLEELRRYAEFRRARSLLGKRGRPGRGRKEAQ
jgi:transcriptional regulator with XRE-family HTH domain